MKVSFKGTKVRVALILMIIGVLYLSIELFYPRDFMVSGSTVESTNSCSLEKSEENNLYYISVTQHQNGNKETITKLECTKKQYDIIDTKDQYDGMNDPKIYYTFYRVNFFNRRTGKILELDNKPLLHGIGASYIVD